MDFQNVALFMQLGLKPVSADQWEFYHWFSWEWVHALNYDYGYLVSAGNQKVADTYPSTTPSQNNTELPIHIYFMLFLEN